MKQKQAYLIACLLLSAGFFQYCSKSSTNGTTSSAASVNTQGNNGTAVPVLPETPYNYAAIALPQHIASALPAVDNTPINNPITNDGATLGRVLFYDKNLSKNNTVSCGSCHRQDLSFSDSAIKSKGFLGGNTDRHSMPLLNVRFYKSGKMFWDERAATLEDQVLQPIQNSTEMGMTLTEAVTKIASLSYYPALFQKAFGSADITSDRISKALAQFVRSIVTYQSRYDQVKQGLASFTADERDGEILFLTAGNRPCAGCHTPPMFLTSAPASGFGLADAIDAGINNSGRFKSGSLRNIANTAPYFHNGSVPTLQAMLASNIPSHGVAPQDQQKLLAFLRTLTDETGTKDVKYANPFQ